MLRLVLLSAMIFSSQALATDAVSDLHQFMKDHVIGKRLVTPMESGSMDAGRLQYDFERSFTFANLTRTDAGLTFQQIVSIKQTNYPVENSQRILPGMNKDRIVSSLCELRRSSALPDRIHGFCHTIANTLRDPTGNANGMEASLKDGMWSFSTQSIGFDDYFANTSTGYKPARSHSTDEFKIVNDKLVFTSTTTSIDLDPVTLTERAGTEDTYTMEAKEL